MRDVKECNAGYWLPSVRDDHFPHRQEEDPSAIVLIALGCAYAFIFSANPLGLRCCGRWRLPSLAHSPPELTSGLVFWFWALPQIPLLPCKFHLGDAADRRRLLFRNGVSTVRASV
jgi:hypothetical protein